MKIRHIVLLFFLLGLPRLASAQPEQSAAAQKSLTAPANLTFGAVAGAVGNDGSAQVILDASIKDKIGTAAFGWGRGQRQIQIAFSGPVGGNDEATPVSLTGLGAGSNAKISFSRLNWRGPNPIERQQIEALCQRLGLPPGSPNPATTCTTSNIKSQDDLALFRYLSHLDNIPWMVGGEITAGQVVQKFVDRKSLEADSRKRLAWQISTRVGAYKSGLGFLLATYSYKETLSPAGAPSQICKPMPGTDVSGATSCTNVVVGRPIFKTTSVLTAELRRFVSRRLAWSPNIQFDFKRNADGDRTIGIEVPVYFLTSGGTSPTGGVRFGWRSDIKELTAVVFVGAAFKLLQ